MPYLHSSDVVEMTSVPQTANLAVLHDMLMNNQDDAQAS